MIHFLLIVLDIAMMLCGVAGLMAGRDLIDNESRTIYAVGGILLIIGLLGIPYAF